MTASLAELLAASRVQAYREAVAAGLAAALPVAVKPLPGLLDIADLDRKDLIPAPGVAVAVKRIRPAEQRMGGLRDVPVEMVAYVVAEDRAVGSPPRRVTRDEIGFALCDGLLALLETPAARWGLPDIGMPEDADARPILTVTTEKTGTAYYAVTWWQILYGQGSPFQDMDGAVPPDLDVAVRLPGDPDWTAEGAP